MSHSSLAMASWDRQAGVAHGHVVRALMLKAVGALFETRVAQRTFSCSLGVEMSTGYCVMFGKERQLKSDNILKQKQKRTLI